MSVKTHNQPKTLIKFRASERLKMTKQCLHWRQQSKKMCLSAFRMFQCQKKHEIPFLVFSQRKMIQDCNFSRMSFYWWHNKTTIPQLFNKMKSTCHEISKLEPNATNGETRMKRIIIHDLRPNARVCYCITKMAYSTITNLVWEPTYWLRKYG
jgi:hypothetical protein